MAFLHLRNMGMGSARAWTRDMVTSIVLVLTVVVMGLSVLSVLLGMRGMFSAIIRQAMLTVVIYMLLLLILLRLVVDTRLLRLRCW